MIYDLAVYRRVVKPQIIVWFADKPKADKLKAMGKIALYTSCPIVAVGYFIGEIFGFTPELNAAIKSLEAFYRVDEVKNKVES